MTRSELILEFIDGTLDGNAEQQLFDELARQPEYRSEMRQFIAIGEAVRADREAFMPPLAVEQSLMTGLGLATLAGGAASGGTAAGAATAAASSGTFLAGLLAKLGLMKGVLPFLVPFLLGGLFVGGGVYLGMKDNGATIASVPSSAGDRETQKGIPDGASGAASPAASGSDAVKESVTAEVATPSASASSSPAAASVSAAPRRSSRTDIADGEAPVRLRDRGRGFSAQSPDARRDPETNLSIDESPTMTVDSSLLEKPIALPAISAPALRESIEAPVIDSTSSIASRSPSAVRPIEMPERSNAPGKFVVEPRAGATILSNENNANVGRAALDEHYAIGISYRIDENLQFGLEFGQERFRETFFYNSAENGVDRRVIRTDQAPLLYWGGLSGRYNAVKLAPIEGMTPFVQMTLGAALHGPLARARAGLRYDMSSFTNLPIALTGAAEGSTLLYFYNNQSMASTNGGLMFGLELTLW